MLVKIADLNTADVSELKAAEDAYPIFMKSLRVDMRKHAPRPAGVHASEVSGCKRKLVYTMRGTAKEDRASVAWKQRFKVGQALHDIMQADLHSMAKQSNGFITFEDEVRISPDTHTIAAKWGIHSSADGVLTFYEKKPIDSKAFGQWAEGDVDCRTPIRRILVEIKSKAPDAFDKLRAPESDHIDQATVYMACLNIPLTWYMYWNKGDQTITPSAGPFLQPFDPKRWAKIEERMAEAWDYLEKEELQGKLPDSKKDEGVLCEFCPYSWTCQPGYLNNRGKRMTHLPVVKGAPP